MNRSQLLKSVTLGPLALSAFCAGGTVANAAGYVQTNLVSDLSGVAAVFDPELKNAWGLSFIPGKSPFWISNQGTNTATLYSVTGETTVTKIDINPPSGLVAIPTTGSGPQGPTGQVSNSNMSAFDVGDGGNGKPAHFIFANLNGTISAWNGGTTAFVQWATPGAVYTGLTVNTAQTTLYAANNATGSIDVYGSNFHPISLGSNAFATPSAISALGFTPFNVQDIGGKVYVTYAPATLMGQEIAGLGDGAVAVFSQSGAFESDKVGSQFASPWGVALAPASFGKFGGDLLVGNFSYDHSEINAFNPTTWAFEGSIPIHLGPGETPGGLWSLSFGASGPSGSPNVLYFTDGTNGQTAGLFGAITSVPEPSTWIMMLAGFAGLGFVGFHRSRKRAVTLAA
jgi:uncharacterized protein (TIGR03118 family)